MRLSIIIPCYNEQEGVKNLCDRLIPVKKVLEKEYNLEILFIDDGSTDNTYKLLLECFGKDKTFKIIKHNKNRNLGGSLKTGFSKAKGDIIVTMDSDCTYPPKEIPSLLKMLIDNPEVDIVTASPYHPQGNVKNVPHYRLFLSKGISLCYSLLLGFRIHTYTALFRVYRRKVIEKIKPRSNNFIGVTEMLIFPAVRGYRIKEYPTTLNAREFGNSKVDFIGLNKIILSHLKLLTKIFVMGKRVR